MDGHAVDVQGLKDEGKVRAEGQVQTSGREIPSG